MKHHQKVANILQQILVKKELAELQRLMDKYPYYPRITRVIISAQG